ncbi:unnamed protein product [Mucor fragilis]
MCCLLLTDCMKIGIKEAVSLGRFQSHQIGISLASGVWFLDHHHRRPTSSSETVATHQKRTSAFNYFSFILIISSCFIFLFFSLFLFKIYLQQGLHLSFHGNQIKFHLNSINK